MSGAASELRLIAKYFGRAVEAHAARLQSEASASRGAVDSSHHQLFVQLFGHRKPAATSGSVQASSQRLAKN